MKLKYCLLAVLLFTLPALAATISVQPVAATVASGESFVASVNVGSVTDLYAFQFDVTFDPTKLSASSITEGTFLPGGGSTFYIAGAIDNVAGTIAFTMDSLLGAVPGVTGSGILSMVQFTALQPGVSAVTLSNIVLSDSAMADLAATPSGASVTVTPEPGTATLAVMGMLALAASVRRRVRTNV